MSGVAQQSRSSTRSPFRLELTVQPGDRRGFELWRDGMRPLFAMDTPERAAFEARLTSYQFADLVIASGGASTTNFQRSAKTVATSPLDHISLLVYAEGGCALDACGRSVEVEAGDVAFIDLARPAAMRAVAYDSLTLIVPRDALEPQVADLDGLHGRVLRKSSPLNAMLVKYLRTLFTEAPTLSAAEGAAAAQGTAGLIAAFAGASDSGRDLVARSSAEAARLRHRQFIEANLEDPDLGPGTLCDRLGVSRATLFRMFEPMGGVRRYILQRRLARAHRLITDPKAVRLHIASIAYRCGFKSASAFSRAFQQTFGMSPTELRTAVEQTEARFDLISGDHGFGSMSRWLLGLDGGRSAAT